MKQASALYTLIIVDDEKNIQEGLSQIVDWASLGFNVAGVFADGRDAVAFINDHPVDVILTDIRMPHVSGLEVAQYVWENHLKTKVLLLTGYKDFEYAKTACEYGVSYYLLKPTQLSELYETFGKLKEQLDREKQEETNLHLLKETLLEQFITDLYFGAFSDEKVVLRQLQRLQLESEFDRSIFTVMHLHIKNYEQVHTHGYGKEQIYKAMHHFWEMKFPELSFRVVYQEGENVTYVVYGAAGLPQKVQEMAADELNEVMGLSVNIAIEGTYESIYEMEKARRRGTASGELIDLKQLIEKQKLLFSYLFSNQAENAVSLLSAMLESLAGVDAEAAHSFIQNLFSLLSKRIADLGIFCDEKLFELPASETDKEKIKQRCVENLSQIARVVGLHAQGTENLAVNHAKDFIKENFARDILLEDVANQVFLSPAYLSRIFKKYVGETFSDYLFKVRMNKAKSLLKNSNLKVYEIAEKVGIQTPKYFFKLFKDFTGLTPTEYRANMTSGEEEGSS